MLRHCQLLDSVINFSNCQFLLSGQGEGIWVQYFDLNKEATVLVAQVVQQNMKQYDLQKYEITTKNN